MIGVGGSGCSHHGVRNKGFSCVAAPGGHAAILHLALERDQDLLQGFVSAFAAGWSAWWGGGMRHMDATQWKR